MEEHSTLEQLVSKGKAVARRLAHVRVLLLADNAQGAECPDEEIVAALGVSPRTVARVRKRVVTEGFQAALDHRPQLARPDKIKIRGEGRPRGCRPELADIEEQELIGMRSGGRLLRAVSLEVTPRTVIVGPGVEFGDEFAALVKEVTEDVTVVDQEGPGEAVMKCHLTADLGSPSDSRRGEANSEAIADRLGVCPEEIDSY
jgi:hypothetical protein